MKVQRAIPWLYAVTSILSFKVKSLLVAMFLYYLVVYDDMLTSSFMNCLVHLNYSQLNQPAIIYIAIEKRYSDVMFLYVIMLL